MGPEGFGGPGGPGGPAASGDRVAIVATAASGAERWRPRRRMRRGDVRAAILLLVEEEPRNGYQVMQEIEARSEGAWRPSPGSVYPAFQLLADEGLVRSESRDGGNLFELTDAGRSYVDEHREQLGSPWTLAGEGVPEGVRELGKLMTQVGIAVKQVMHAGGKTQAAEAAKVLAETRARSTASSPKTSRTRAEPRAAGLHTAAALDVEPLKADNTCLGKCPGPSPDGARLWPVQRRRSAPLSVDEG